MEGFLDRYLWKYKDRENVQDVQCVGNACQLQPYEHDSRDPDMPELVVDSDDKGGEDTIA